MGDTLSSPSTGSSEEAATPWAVDGSSSFDSSRLPVELTSKYKVLEKIGCGSFGSVYKVKRLDSNVLYAAKYVETVDSTATEVSFSYLKAIMCHNQSG